MPINLPKSDIMANEKMNIAITITADLDYYINNTQTSLEALEGQLKHEMGVDNKLVVLMVDETVPVKYFVKVAGIANKLGAKVSISTEPE